MSARTSNQPRQSGGVGCWAGGPAVGEMAWRYCQTLRRVLYLPDLTGGHMSGTEETPINFPDWIEAIAGMAGLQLQKLSETLVVVSLTPQPPLPV